jgi:hypothetical protein
LNHVVPKQPSINVKGPLCNSKWIIQYHYTYNTVHTLISMQLCKRSCVLCKRSCVGRGMMASLYPYICFIVLISLLMRVEGQEGRLAHDEGEGFVSSFYLYIHNIRISKNFQGILLSRVLQFNHCYHFIIYYVNKILIHIYIYIYIQNFLSIY